MPLVAKGLATRWPLKSGKTFCWSDIRNSEVYEAHVIKQLDDVYTRALEKSINTIQ